MTKQQRATYPAPPSSAEAGFTLIEALVAMVILIFGLMAVSNLFLVATSSTSVANQGTAAAVAASEVLEALRATPWPNLVLGGDAGDTDGDGILDTDVGPTLPTCDNPAGSYNCDADTPGVGRVHVRWVIRGAPPGAVRTLFVQVQADGTGALSGARSRATFSMFRACTDTPVGAGGSCPDPPQGGGF